MIEDKTYIFKHAGVEIKVSAPTEAEASKRLGLILENARTRTDNTEYELWTTASDQIKACGGFK